MAEETKLGIRQRPETSTASATNRSLPVRNAHYSIDNIVNLSDVLSPEEFERVLTGLEEKKFAAAMQKAESEVNALGTCEPQSPYTLRTLVEVARTIGIPDQDTLNAIKTLKAGNIVKNKTEELKGILEEYLKFLGPSAYKSSRVIDPQTEGMNPVEYEITYGPSFSGYKIELVVLEKKEKYSERLFCIKGKKETTLLESIKCALSGRKPKNKYKFCVYADPALDSKWTYDFNAYSHPLSYLFSCIGFAMNNESDENIKRRAEEAVFAMRKLKTALYKGTETPGHTVNSIEFEPQDKLKE